MKASKQAKQPLRQGRKSKESENMMVIWQKLGSLEKRLHRMNNLLKTLPEAVISTVAVQELASIKRKFCLYYNDGLCTMETWSNKEGIPQSIGEPVFRENNGPEWLIKPSAFFCTICTVFLEDRLDDVESKQFSNPLSGVRYQFTCRDCGNKGWIAAEISCTKCGRKTSWGWWPKEG